MEIRELKGKVRELNPVLSGLLALGSDYFFHCCYLVSTAALVVPALSVPLHDGVCLHGRTCFLAVPRVCAAVGAAKSGTWLLKLPMNTGRRV